MHYAYFHPSWLVEQTKNTKANLLEHLSYNHLLWNHKLLAIHFFYKVMLKKGQYSVDHWWELVFQLTSELSGHICDRKLPLNSTLKHTSLCLLRSSYISTPCTSVLDISLHTCSRIGSFLMTRNRSNSKNNLQPLGEYEQQILLFLLNWHDAKNECLSKLATVTKQGRTYCNRSVLDSFGQTTTFSWRGKIICISNQYHMHNLQLFVIKGFVFTSSVPPCPTSTSCHGYMGSSFLFPCCPNVPSGRVGPPCVPSSLQSSSWTEAMRQ